MDFSGKVVLITGASSGIGAATANYLSKLGATVALTGRNAENLNKVGAECEAVGKQKPFLLVADVTKTEDNRRVIDEIIKKFGKLDVLVNNAGIGGYGSIETTSLEQYDEIMKTNMRSVYHLTMLAVPHLIKSKGNIVNVSSVAGTTVYTNKGRIVFFFFSYNNLRCYGRRYSRITMTQLVFTQTRCLLSGVACLVMYAVAGTRSFSNALAYCVSKAALDQFTRCVALDLAPKQVRVNSVNPAVIVTDFLSRMGMSPEDYATYLKNCEKSHPLGRVGQPPEVAAAIAFLAADTASFITGTCLCVDGGKNVLCPR